MLYSKAARSAKCSYENNAPQLRQPEGVEIVIAINDLTNPGERTTQRLMIAKQKAQNQGPGAHSPNCVESSQLTASLHESRS